MLKNIGYTPELANEKQLHIIIQEMSEFCSPNTKFKEIRNAFLNKTLTDYILNTGVDIEDNNIVEKLRKLNETLDNTQKADGRLWNTIASKFFENGEILTAMKYLENLIPGNCEKEAANYLFEQLKGTNIKVEDIPQCLFKAAFFSRIASNQLSNLLLLIPKM